MTNKPVVGLSIEAGAEHFESELNRVSMTRSRRCRLCGKEVLRTVKRCPNCGQPLSARPA